MNRCGGDDVRQCVERRAEPPSHSEMSCNGSVVAMMSGRTWTIGFASFVELALHVLFHMDACDVVEHGAPHVGALWRT